MADDPTLAAALREADARGDTARAQAIARQIMQARQSGGKGGVDVTSGVVGQLYAAAHGLEDTATFGLGDKVAAGLDSVMNGRSYSENYSNIQQDAAAAAGNNPLTSLAGTIAGVAAGGGAISAATKGARALPVVGRAVGAVDDALAAQKGQAVRNVARAATAGGAFGAADAALRGGSDDDVLLGGATGAVVGPVAGKVLTSVIKAASPAATKAMRLLADKIGENPDTLQRAFNNFKTSTGRVPTMAELVGLKSQGELRQVAGDNPTVGAALSTAQGDTDTARSISLPDRVVAITGTRPTNAKTLIDTRKATMTAAMNPIRDTPVPVNEDDLSLLNDRRVSDLVRASKDPVLRTKLDNVRAKLAFQPDGVADDLTVDDFDNIRKMLRGEQSARANPANSRHNPHIADSYGTLADSISDIAISHEPRYGAALEQFGQDSRFIAGFKHGMAGKNVGDADRSDLINALNTPEGQHGHAVGILSRLAGNAAEGGGVSTANDLANSPGLQAQLHQAFGGAATNQLARAGEAEAQGARALRTIAPSTVQPETHPSDVMHAAHAAAAVTYHSPTAIGYHVSRIIGSKVKMAPAVQQKVAEYLANPRMTQQGINLLRKAGASNDDLRRLATSIAASAGVASSNAATGH